MNQTAWQQTNLDRAIAEKLVELSGLFLQRAEQRAEPLLLVTEWMTARALGAQLGISADTVSRRAKSGVEFLPGRRIIAQKASERTTRFAIVEIPRRQDEPVEDELERRLRLVG